MLLCFVGMHFNLYTKADPLYVDMIFKTHMAWEFNYMYGKTCPIMYNKNVKKLLKYCVVK